MQGDGEQEYEDYQAEGQAEAEAEGQAEAEAQSQMAAEEKKRKDGKMKIVRVTISGAALKMIFTKGTEKTIVKKTPIPDDAELISQEFDWETKCVSLYFSSKQSGQSCLKELH